MQHSRNIEMKTRISAAALIVAAVLWAPLARAEPAIRVQNEVSFLFGYIAGSGCEFYRNGTWYDSQKAVSHLREKYKYLIDHNLVASTEQFIERGASESSFSGKPYQIRCNGGTPVDSQPWLREKLAQLRAAT
jgi:hypothetical protein